MASSFNPFVSVVICSYNGADHLGQTLAAVAAQTYPKSRYEVVVIDDGSQDATAAVAAERGARVISHEYNRGLGVARNTGLSAARGEIIAFTDDDCLPHSAWLEELIRPYRDSAVMATGGRTFAVSQETPTERYMDAVGYGNPAPRGIATPVSRPARLLRYLSQMASPLHLKVQSGDTLEAIFTLNASYRTALLRNIGGFDINLRAAEDTDVSYRLYDAYPSYRIVSATAARMGHRHRRRLWPWIAQTFERSQDAYAEFSKEGRLPPIYPFPVAVILVSLVTAVISPWIAAITLIFSPLCLYWWWQIRGGRYRVLDRIRFPYMQLFLESAALLGYVRAAFRQRKI